MCYIESPGFVQQGWQCPVCRTVNAPWAPLCYGCPPKSAPVMGTGTGDAPPSLWPTTISATATVYPDDTILVNDAAQFTAVEGIQVEFNYGPHPQPDPYWRNAPKTH